jgi:predicted metallopeptidase
MPCQTAQQFKTHTHRLDLSQGLREAAAEVCRRVPDLGHVDVEQVQFALFYSRKAQRVLTYARCYPLPTGLRRIRKRWYRLTPVHTEAGLEARYILAFAWTRYWTLKPRERLEVLVHELYHISPDFDGEPRRFATGSWHGPGREWFDRQVRFMSEKYLPRRLENQFPALSVQLHDGLRVSGQRLQVPHWVAITNEAQEAAS